MGWARIWAKFFLNSSGHTGRKSAATRIPGANPTTAIYNASAVKIYDSMCNLVQSVLFILQINALNYYNAGLVVVNLQAVGLAPGSYPTIAPAL
jgi:hypothetical protein